MAAKRKKKKMKKNQVQVPFPVLLANVLVLVAVLGLSYMWLCARCDALGKEIKIKEGELTAAQRRLTKEQDHWSTMTSLSQDTLSAGVSDGKRISPTRFSIAGSTSHRVLSRSKVMTEIVMRSLYYSFLRRFARGCAASYTLARCWKSRWV